jgi:glutamyl-tRNA synthetase
VSSDPAYRGRIAPSPTGFLHLGHARTFLIAAERARQAHGRLVLRNEDLDPERSRPEYARAMYEDLKWLGIEWSEGPDCAGQFAPYSQSERRPRYLAAWRRLKQAGFLYPCRCSRKDWILAASAPNESEDEAIYPGKCRNCRPEDHDNPGGVNWRFRVPDGEVLQFDDGQFGRQFFIAGKDFGDFLIWRRDDVPAYQLAVVVDDSAMHISEVVRGRDLLKSTARQLLLYRALELPLPGFFHCDLVRDERGARLAKRHDALSIRHLREAGSSPEQVRMRALAAC